MKSLYHLQLDPDWSLQISRVKVVYKALLPVTFYIFLSIALHFFVQVAVGCIMSGYQISAELSQYVIAASFLQPSLNPVFFAVFLLEFREGYMAVLHFVPEKIVRLCKGLFYVVTGGA